MKNIEEWPTVVGVTELPPDVQRVLACEMAEMIIAIIVAQADGEQHAREGLDALTTDMKRRITIHYTKGSA